ncbi:MAG: bifunctional metallophosphatase/5'-nucleotidase [Prevotella sp.]
MKRLAALGLAFLYASNLIMAENKDVTIRLVATSDVHGCFQSYDFIERKPTETSLSKVSSYVKELRKTHGDNVILLDNGDILQGQPTCYYSNYVMPELPNAAALAENYIGYDAQTIGNHDVETGHAVYDKWIGELKCPTLGANIIDTTTGKPYLPPYIIIEREGVKVAILGMITAAIPNWLPESLWAGLRFDDMVVCAEKWVKYIKEVEKAEVIVGLFHSGWNGGISTIHYKEDTVEEIARTIDGFDVIFFGHDHFKRKAVVRNTSGNDVLCLNPSCNATYVADATVRVSLTNGKMTGKRTEGKLISMSELPDDEEFNNVMKNVKDSIEQYVNKKIGRITKTIISSDSFFGSSEFNDLIHDIQLSVTDADISFNAPLTFDSKIEEGDIYISDMFKLYRYENYIYVMKLSGKEIRKHLEMSYDQWVNTMTSADDHIMLLSENTQYDKMKCGFKNLTFNFDSAAGIDYTVDVTKPDGQKVTILRMSNGEPFVEDKWYKVVVNSYRGNGGGELLTKGAGIPTNELKNRIIWSSDRDQRHYIIQEIMKRGTITPRKLDNWKFIPEELTIPAIERDRKLLFEEK